MKISKLVQQLVAQMAEHGDVPVYVADCYSQSIKVIEHLDFDAVIDNPSAAYLYLW